LNFNATTIAVISLWQNPLHSKHVTELLFIRLCVTCSQKVFDCLSLYGCLSDNRRICLGCFLYCSLWFSTPFAIAYLRSCRHRARLKFNLDSTIMQFTKRVSSLWMWTYYFENWCWKHLFISFYDTPITKLEVLKMETMLQERSYQRKWHTLLKKWK
jgi:hypothetical protein